MTRARDMDVLRDVLRINPIYRLWRRFLTWFGDVMFATEPPVIRARHIRELLRRAIPGDILLRKYNYCLDSYFIPGKYSHSGIVIGHEHIMHSIAEGVVEDDLIDFVKDADGFMLLRPNYQTEANVENAVKFAFEHKGCPYDFLFEININEDGTTDIAKDAFYCHELSYFCLRAGNIVVPMTGKCVTANDLLAALPGVYVAG